MNAIRIETFGNPAEVVKAVNVPDVGALAPGEVVIALEAAPLNQSGSHPGPHYRDVRSLAPLIAAGTISVPVVATYGFGQFKEAIADAAKSRGKVLFTPKV
jgi:NADPH:quinone reductase-like Zn-dependent oxidoreductase